LRISLVDAARIMKSKAAPVTLGAFDAKTRLSELLDRVEAGEVIVITRHGAPIATLQPYDQAIDAKKAQKAIDGILALRTQLLKSGPGMSLAEIRAAIDEGHKR
jgi:prevent-host-death family protein